MNTVTTPPSDNALDRATDHALEPVDFHAAYLRLVGKVYRTGMYYRMCSANYRTKYVMTKDPVAEGVSRSLARAADDMDFIVAKAFGVLPEAQRRQIREENPTPFTSVNNPTSVNHPENYAN